jgi:hypothetical protein
VSAIFHACLIFALGYAIRSAPQGGTTEPVREGGIALKAMDSESVEYLSEEDVRPTAESSSSPAPSAAPFDEPPPSDPSSSLPASQPLLGLGVPASGQPVSARGAERGNSGVGLGNTGQTKTSFYGISGVGSTFVYVIDRSGSMGGTGRNALHAAKTELLASLDGLTDVQQFQILFYNDRVIQFEIPGRKGALIFGSDANKSLAANFVRSVEADGATRHEEALKAALRLSPEVVFFLTDADEPQMSAGQLSRLRRMNGGNASINCVEFGLGPSSGDKNFLAELAEQNGGQYRYVDIIALLPVR